MFNTCARLLVVVSCLAVTGAMADAESSRDGEFREAPGGVPQVWDVERQEWLAPEAFWERYAARSGGLTWGRGTDYPPYGEVDELDTFIIELDSGPCLMEFFHSRWRRANDVRRWDPAFDEYGGCPHVFD